MAQICLQLSTNRALTLAFASENQRTNTVQLPDKVKNSRVLILGGTGRVGGSTAIALSNLCPDLRIVVGGRNRSVHGMSSSLFANSEQHI